MSGRALFLDGLRGLAAVVVVLCHYLLAFDPLGPLTREATNGADIAVFLFFLMSGLVLTASFERTGVAPTAVVVRRCVRLGLPAAAAVILAMAICACVPEWKQTAADISHSQWLASFNWGNLWWGLFDVSGLGIILGTANTTLFGVLASHLPEANVSLDSPVWSLHIELWGSALILGLVWARSCGHRTYMTALGLGAAVIGANSLILFLIGNLSRYALKFSTTRVINILAAMALLVGLSIACLQPYSFSNSSVIWYAFHLPDVEVMLHSFGWFHPDLELSAILIYFGVILTPWVRRLLQTLPFTWLGKLSFSIYLLHWPVMMSLGSFLFVTMSLRDTPGAVALTVSLGLAATAALAVVFEATVDRIAIELSRGMVAGAARKPRLSASA